MEAARITTGVLVMTESLIKTPRVRWMSSSQEATGYPVGTRLTSRVKAKIDAAAEGIPTYAWLTEDDERYKAITTADMGEVVPTVEKIMSSFELNDLLVMSAPDPELIDYILEGHVVPSVTSIPSFVVRSDGLQRWKTDQKLDLLRHITGGTLPAEDAEWATMKRDLMNYEDESYSIRGSRWHSAIEKAIRGEEVTGLTEEDLPAFQRAMPFILDKIGHLTDVDLERSFVHPDGYGGTADYRAGNIVIDWKTKEKRLTTKKGTVLSTITQIDNPIQLAAYADGLGIDSPRLVNCYVNVLDGEVAFHEYSHPDMALMAWQHLLMFWKLMIQPQIKHGTIFST